MKLCDGPALFNSSCWTVKFKQVLANLAFEDRVIFPGDIQQSFIYLKWDRYNKIRMKVLNITNNKIQELMFDVSVKR